VSGGRLPARELKSLRLHARVIIRDRYEAFIGSQSLRQVELDSRREIGVIVRNNSVVDRLVATFLDDWSASERAKGAEAKLAAEVPRKAAKAVARMVGKKVPIHPVVNRVVKAVARKNGKVNRKKVEEAVKNGVQAAIRSSVKNATKEVLEKVLEESA
jgi:hypothetical protein